MDDVADEIRVTYPEYSRISARAAAERAVKRLEARQVVRRDDGRLSTTYEL